MKYLLILMLLLAGCVKSEVVSNRGLLPVDPSVPRHTICASYRELGYDIDEVACYKKWQNPRFKIGQKVRLLVDNHYDKSCTATIRGIDGWAVRGPHKNTLLYSANIKCGEVNYQTDELLETELSL